ncbi:MAG: ABC transporter substrate-binding protein [Rhodospirillaceae bacterium]
MKSAIGVIVFLAGITVSWMMRGAATSSPDIEPLTLGVAENTGDIPTLIALEKGFCRDEGLDVTIKSWPAGKLAFESMLRGELDVATVADTPIVLQSFKRKDFVIIATFSHNTPYRLIANRRDGIRVAADLRGHTIGVMAGTTSQFFLHSVLADLGIPISEITEVNIPSEQSADALVNDRIDAVAAFDPYGYHAELALGDRALVIPYEKGRHEETFNFVTRRDFPKNRPTATQKLLRATQRAIEWARSHPAEAIALVARRLKIDEKVQAKLWDNYHFGLSLDQVLIVSLENQARWAIFNHLGGGEEMPNYLEYIDTSTLEAVLPATVTIIR